MAKNDDQNLIEGTDIPKSIVAKAIDQKRFRSDDFISIYANNVAVSISVWDLSLTFGESIGEEDGKPVIEETIKVLMSREMAKVMNRLLTHHIAEYEKKYGPINIPEIKSTSQETSSKT